LLVVAEGDYEGDVVERRRRGRSSGVIAAAALAEREEVPTASDAVEVEEATDPAGLMALADQVGMTQFVTDV
jgi:hypothetical protein